MLDLFKKIDFSRVDYILLSSVMFLLVLGAAIVFSSSSYRADQLTGDSAYYFKNHMIKVIIGLIFLAVLILVDYRVWLNISPILYLGAIVLLVTLFLPLPIVISKNEASRWLGLGPFTFQPSDFARYVLVFLMARLLFENKEYLETWKGFLVHIFVAGVIIVLIAAEKDLGTAIMVTIIVFSMFFLAEVKFIYILSLGMTAITAGLAYLVRNPYMLKRVYSYIDVSINNNFSDYQLQQSINAFRFGGIFGRGIGNSIQKYEFLPEAHKDFIFSVIGEELGMIGAIAVLVLFFVVMYRGFQIAKTAPDGYGKLLAGGITICIGLYAFFNAAVTLAILPTTGIPMPFISYGGSAMVTHLAAVGVLINISSQSRKSFMNYPSRSTYQSRINRLNVNASKATPKPKKRKKYKRRPAPQYKVGL